MGLTGIRTESFHVIWWDYFMGKKRDGKPSLLVESFRGNWKSGEISGWWWEIMGMSPRDNIWDQRAKEPNIPRSTRCHQAVAVAVHGCAMELLFGKITLAGNHPASHVLDHWWSLLRVCKFPLPCMGPLSNLEKRRIFNISSLLYPLKYRWTIYLAAHQGIRGMGLCICPTWTIWNISILKKKSRGSNMGHVH